MDDKRVRFISSKTALKSIRDLGITLIQGVCELVDNSVDADSKNINIYIHKTEKNHCRVVVQDDGCGIPDGPNSVQRALRFGGRIPLPSRKQNIGRFGFGLSQTAICLTKHTKVYSKSSSGVWRSCYMDIEELERDNAYLPVEKQNDRSWEDIFPYLKGYNSGTIVSLHEIDRPGYKDLEWFFDDLKIELGRIHRYSLHDGLKINISFEGNELEQVRVRDPMVQLQSSLEVSKLGVEEIRANDSIVFDGVDFKNVPIIIDPETGLPARITIKMINADPGHVQSSLGITSEKTSVISRELAKIGFHSEHQGFYLVRAGREVASAETFGIYPKTHHHNYFHGEILFPTCLDKWFGIEVNKSEHRIDGRLKDRLRTICKSTINQMGREYISKSVQYSAKKKSKKPSNMEKHSNRLRKVAPRISRSNKEINELREKKEHRIKQIVETAKRDAEMEKSNAEDFLYQAELVGDEIAIRDAESRLKQIQRIKDEEINDVINRFNVDVFFRKIIIPLPSDDIYAVEDFHDEIWVSINSNSKFFQNIYEKSKYYPEMISLLDLMIFSLAYSEANKYNSLHMSNFWVNTRKLVSRVSTIFISSVDNKISEIEENKTFRTWKEVANSISDLLDIEVPIVKKGYVGTDWYREIAIKMGIKSSPNSSPREIFDEIIRLADIDSHPSFYTSNRISLQGIIVLEEAVNSLREGELKI